MRFLRRVPVLVVPLVLSAGVAAAAGPLHAWTDNYDGGIGMPDQGTALLVDPQGDILVAGESTDQDGTADLYTRKLSRVDGHQIWESRWGDPGGNDMAMVELAFDPHGDIIVGGYVRGCVG
jgi:hypothetical protein